MVKRGCKLHPLFVWMQCYAKFMYNSNFNHLLKQMNYKEQLTELSSLLNILRSEVVNQLTDINTKRLTAVAQMPEYEVSNSTLVMSKLKYEEIKFNKTDTWPHIATRPEIVLHRWARRLWLINQTEFGYNKKEEIEQQYGVSGRKSIESFLWSVSSYVNAIFVNPATAGAHLNNLVSAYNKGTLASKKKFEDFFEILQEELIKYENDDNK
jgi:hypothetical protein